MTNTLVRNAGELFIATSQMGTLARTVAVVGLVAALRLGLDAR
eukprot:CAMPEP_0198589344 /NCGR_PEP_ID=MMETSP1462-20131121/134252_1 /TAXON_ID=1333877 /ORGANISM="Brandtodinium nutriculum, Strain RCC3387" /LENGTH=42 /DNA_ID= /DNA_START= /DNA_END= /DNA_ORIENTATION=